MIWVFSWPFCMKSGRGNSTTICWAWCKFEKKGSAFVTWFVTLNYSSHFCLFLLSTISAGVWASRDSSENGHWRGRCPDAPQLQSVQEEKLNPPLALAFPGFAGGKSVATTGNPSGQRTERHMTKSPGLPGDPLCLSPAAVTWGVPAITVCGLWIVAGTRSRRLWRAGRAWQEWLISHPCLWSINMEKWNPWLSHWKSTLWIILQYFPGLDRYQRAFSQLVSSLQRTAPGNLLWQCV